MSAVNIIETPGGVMIFTDAAVYDGQGVLVEFHSKVTVTADGSMAVTGRGNAVFPALVAKALDRHGMTIDDVEEVGETFLDRGFEALETQMIEVAGKALNNVWIAGYSQRDGRVKVAQWTNCPPPGAPRFMMVPEAMAPDLTPAGRSRLQSVLRRNTSFKADPKAFGIELMKSQRLDPGSAQFGCEGRFLVGGHILLTKITHEGIEQTIVHEWPEDRIGERIRPSANFDEVSAPNVEPIHGMSRQQRRRAEKLAKKGRAA